MDLHIKDVVELKKTHPCGSKQWEITRVGMDIKLKCLGCGHELMLPRSFGYAGSDVLVLEDITFDIKKGEVKGGTPK